LSSSEEDTDIKDQNICDVNEEDNIEKYRGKCFICDEFGKDGELCFDSQVVVFGHSLHVVGGDFRMVVFVTCAWEEEIQNENTHKVSEYSLS
jgi:hypothetical protein